MDLTNQLISALQPLANLDLTGVTGEIVYQRNQTKITVQDVLTAKKLLDNLKKQPNQSL